MKDISTIPISNKTKILVIMPHPDDEAVFASGFIHYAASQGAKVNLVVITNGEKSTLRTGVKDDLDLGEHRKKELGKASRIMGVHTLVCANFPDGELQEKYEEVTKFVVEDILEYKPDYILTLEPDGIYGHPDHLTLTRIISVIHETKQVPFSLIYATVPKGFKPTTGAAKMAAKNKIKPLAPTYKLKLSLKEQYIKEHTCLAHYSQLGENKEFWPLWKQNKMLENEYFVIIEK